MTSKTKYESDLACENESSDRNEKMENSFINEGLKITKTTFDPIVPNGLLPRDAYYGIHCGPIWLFDEDKARCTALLCADKLTQLIRPIFDPDRIPTVLIAGIGNRHSAPDSLGPLCADKIIIRSDPAGFQPKTAAISPGVRAQTGIDTADHVCAVAERIKADLLIAVDSLSSREPSRLGSFIQLGNCGITPGAGTDKRGKGINFQTLGIPVVAIGIPAIINAASLTELPSLPRNSDMRCDSATQLAVTPKDCSAVMEIGASVIANAINICLSSSFG